MTLKELMQAMVVTEGQDDRMALVEDNATLLEQSAGEPVVDEEMVAELETARSELATQKQKYIDRFFGGSEKESDPEKETEEEKKSITTDDLVKELGE